MANKNSQMRFWGVEVKSGESVVVEPRTTLVHLSQACLDEVKKGKKNDSISLFVKTGDQKLAIGHLYADKIPQLYFDLVFDKKFVLSHDGKSGSIHIQGYIADTEKSGIEPKVSLEEAKKENKSAEKDSSTDDDDENDDESEDEESDQVKSVEDSSDDDSSDNEDDDSEDEPEETPHRAKVSEKRAAESSKTPAQKKAKFVTPEKTDGKKGAVHIATPYPSKQTKPQSSNTSASGAFRCTPCNRTFNSDGALQSHTKAKHGAGK